MASKAKRGRNKPHATGFIAGCDISGWQGVIDWETLAKNIHFVFMKATEGSTFVDKTFATNWAQAKANNVPRGAYHFFRPLEPVDNQIHNFVTAVGSLKKGDLAPVLDLEVPKDWKTIPQAKRVPLVVQWLEGVEEALGVQPMIYLSPSFVGDILGTEFAQVLGKYKLWIANYNVSSPTVPSPWTTWVFWQYSEHGKLPGINDDEVDLDWLNGTTLDDLAAHVLKKGKRRKKNKQGCGCKHDKKGKKHGKKGSKKNKKSSKKTKNH